MSYNKGFQRSLLAECPFARQGLQPPLPAPFLSLPKKKSPDTVAMTAPFRAFQKDAKGYVEKHTPCITIATVFNRFLMLA
jgi:hypothetical protein